MPIHPLNNLDNYKCYLASKSPRRQQILSMIDIDFKIAPAIDIDESFPISMPADDVAQHIASKKADAYSQLILKEPNSLIITADTVVICDDVILGKPADYDDARRMLRQLSGKTHKVVTGVTINCANHRDAFSATSLVTFRQLDNDEIDYYISKYAPFDKAGAYGIQEWIGAAAVENITGSFYNVMGLPIEALYCRLAKVPKCE
ncbi:MAG: septum formation protein Maf [Muribaculaceae bacterium]|nr:septum formation protein Maf [Muribaculaceae bacterium]